MGGNTNFPTALDDNASLLDVTDNVSSLLAAHHNNLKEAIKAVEAKLGINNSQTAGNIDSVLKSPTMSHAHDGASGMGRRIDPTTILIPSGGYPSGGYLYDHLMSPTLHSPIGLQGTGIATALSPGVIKVPSGPVFVPFGMISIATQSQATVSLAASAPVLLATGAATIVSQSQATVIIGALIPTVQATGPGGSVVSQSATGILLYFA